MKSDYVCLSANTRKKLHVVVKATSLLATVLSIPYLGFVLSSLYRHRFLLHVLIISIFDDLYKNLICLGVLTFLISAMGYKLNANLKNQPTNPSLPRTHRLWVILLLLTLLVNLGCVYLIGRVEAVVDSEIGPRLKHGMSRYMETHAWSSALDKVQTYLQCCGVQGPSDWYATAWIPLDKLSGHNVDYKLVQPTGRVRVPLVPTSCCRVASAECGHRAWMEAKTKTWADIKAMEASQVHGSGCEHAVQRIIHLDLLTFKIILIAAFVLQVVLVVTARFLHSSTINSMMLGRPQGSAPGWLFGPRMFSRKQRSGYLQYYDDKCHYIEVSEPEESETDKSKSKWKCLPKVKCLKSGKSTDTEDQPSPNKGKFRLKSQCLVNLKTKCSKRFKKKKKEDEDYVALVSDSAVESESDIKPESEVEENTDDESNEEVGPRNESPRRMRTGGGNYTGHHSTRSEESSLLSVKKKISGNLIDVEVAFEQNRHRKGTKRNLKFSPKRVSNHPPQKSPQDVKVISNNRLEPKKRGSAVLQDFKIKRELFEKAAKAKIKSQKETGETGKAKISIPVTTKSVNLIDLDAVESVKSISTEMTSQSSNRNYRETHPIVLRNYPPLTPPGELTDKPIM